MRYLAFTLLIVLQIASCGTETQETIEKPNPFDQLSEEEKDYVERFNVIAKDIRDYPPRDKNIEEYFHIFKSVSALEDAKIFFLGERHTHTGNRLWSAAFINRMIKKGDVVLFEGWKAGTPVDSVVINLTTHIFAAREYEKLQSHRVYRPGVISKIERQYSALFFKTKPFLALDVLNLQKGKGFYWDLMQNKKCHPDGAQRNAEMVQTIKNNLSGKGRIFVIAGALHLPHYEFAYSIKREEALDVEFPARPRMPPFLATPGAKKDEINMVYYDYWSKMPNPWGDTKVIFEFLKDQDFAVLIPKNIPEVDSLVRFFPKNSR